MSSIGAGIALILVISIYYYKFRKGQQSDKESKISSNLEEAQTGTISKPVEMVIKKLIIIHALI